MTINNHQDRVPFTGNVTLCDTTSEPIVTFQEENATDLNWLAVQTVNLGSAKKNTSRLIMSAHKRKDKQGESKWQSGKWATAKDAILKAAPDKQKIPANIGAIMEAD